MNLQRFVGPVVAVVLLAAVGGGVWYSNSHLRQESVANARIQAEAAQALTVNGLIGSEKEAFFADPAVQAALSRYHITLTVEKAGSRAIAHKFEPAKYDFGFPSGAPAAAELKSVAKAPETYSPFYTPIVIASWRPIALILKANHIVEERDGIYYIVDLPALLNLIKEHKRWKELQDSAAFATNKAVL